MAKKLYILISLLIILNLNGQNLPDTVLTKEHFLYVSASGIYSDIYSTFEYNILWLPFGYNFVMSKNIKSHFIDLLLGYAYPIKKNMWGYSNNIYSLLGIKTKIEYKYSFNKKEYIGIGVVYLLNKNITKLHIINSNNEENIIFRRDKLMIIPKVGAIVFNKFYFDMAIGCSLNFTHFKLLKSSLPQNKYEGIDNVLSNKQKLILPYFEMNIGIKISK